MAEPILNRPRVVSCIGERVAARMPQHVNVNLEREAGALTDALDQAIDGIGGERRAALFVRRKIRMPLRQFLSRASVRQFLCRHPVRQFRFVVDDHVGEWRVRQLPQQSRG